MNTRHNIVMAIELMEHVKALEAKTKKKVFNMAGFQLETNGDYPHSELVKTEEEVLECGTTCCFSGWIALDPFFKEQGIHQTCTGAAIFDDLESNSEAKALSILFDVPWQVASDLIYCNGCYKAVTTPADVIAVLLDWIYYYHDNKEITNELSRTNSI